MNIGFRLVMVFVLAGLAVVAAFLIRSRGELTRNEQIRANGYVGIFGFLAGWLLGMYNPFLLGIAMMLLMREIVSIISPSADLPKSYVLLLHIGSALMIVAIWGDIARSIMYPGNPFSFFPYSLLIPLILGIVISIIAEVLFRPRGKKWEIFW